MIKLLVKFGDESREVEFDVTEISIGRSTDSVLPLQDKKSSRKHAKIEKVNGEYRVNDLGSGNGTKVNGKDVNTHTLAKGDEICIGLTSMFVLAVDGPARPAAVAPPPAAVVPAVVAAPAAVAASAPPPAHTTAPTARADRDSMEEARRKATRRALAARRSSGWVGTAASIIVLIGIAAGGYYLYTKYENENEAKREARAAEVYKAGEKGREAEAKYKELAKLAEADPVEDSTIEDARAKAEQYGALYDKFDTLLSNLKQRRAEQIGRDDFATVDARITSALRDRRFSDALQALKDLKAGTETTAAGGLVAKVCDTINAEFKSIDDYGRKLSDEKKYTIAADHYRLQAPKFKGTEHFKYLMYKPESLEHLKKAEAETATAKGQPAKPEPDNSLAKADPVPAPKPEPVMPRPEPVMPKPEPAMPKEMPKEMPKPAMPKEMPKPPPPPPPPPPKPEPKPEPKPAPEPIKPGAPFKKPEVLCDCKKIVKGVYCLKCDRMLAQEDMRNGVCKRCEEKPKKIDLCVKKYYMVDGQPDKRSEKPILFEGKLYDFAYEDKARIIYFCDGCQDTADASGEVKHKDDCAAKTVIKVCSKSGAPPHGGEKK